ncbi:replicative DNA helicase [Bryobacter aggregatus]|uniref:replicative DNA helicase n=1 Tax=Bryobacter aggregatus TaxID=360054 RepID=UPI0004E13B78|nr:DnaB-like helicase C-terminal domain-containing protein [Bryobacter aggregatus]
MKESALDRVGLPASIDAERMTLGSVMVDPEVLPGVVAELTTDHFSTEKHRRIFQSMLRLSELDERIDRVTLANDLMRRGELESIGGLSYLMELDEGIPQRLNVSGYIGILREKSALRALCHLGASLSERAALGIECAEAIATDTAERLTGLVATNSSGMPATVASIIEGAGTQMLGRSIEESSRGIGLGLWPELSRRMPALLPETLCILAAPPAGGKTTLLLNLVMHASLSGKHAIVFSLEMSGEELIRRWVCAGAKINSQHLSKGTLNEQEQREAIFQLGEISGLAIRIDSGNSDTPAKIRAAVHKVRQKQPVDLIAIDFLQLVQPGKGGLRGTEAADYVAYQFKSLAREFKCPVIALSQFSNEGLDAMKEGRVSLRYARNSGAIYQACDYGLILYPKKLGPGEVVSESRIPMRLKIDKHRNGPEGEIDLLWDKPRYRIFEAAE